MAPHDGGGSTDSTSEIDELLPEAQTHRRYTQSTKRGPTRQRKNSYSALGRQRFGRKYHSLIAFSTIIYWTSVSLIPVYNKHFFQKSLYPYPVATAGIQLGVVSILLAVLNIVQHIVSSNRNTYNSSGSLVIASRERSWIFGPHFLWKIKWCFPIGCLFGLKYGITNLGLDLVPAPTHLLLQSTDLVWTQRASHACCATVAEATWSGGTGTKVRSLLSWFNRHQRPGTLLAMRVQSTVMVSTAAAGDGANSCTVSLE